MSTICNNADKAAESVWSGDTADDAAVNAFKNWWTNDDGPPARLNDDAIAAEIIGAALIVFAGITLAMKIAFIVQLITLAIEVAQAIATAFVSFGATTAEVPGFIAATRVICRQLIKQVLEHIRTVIKDLLEKAKNLFKKLGERRAARKALKFDEKLLADLKKVNPGFNPPHPSFSNNCTHCVQAYELRRRGFDAEAKMLPQHLWSSGGRPLGDIESTWGRSFTSGGKADIEKAFSEPGSRGVVAIRWNNGGGHVFNVENVNGEVRYIDAQSGKANVGHYFNTGHSTSYVRLDDVPTPNAGQFVQPARP